MEVQGYHTESCRGFRGGTPLLTAPRTLESRKAWGRERKGGRGLTGCRQPPSTPHNAPRTHSDSPLTWRPSSNGQNSPQGNVYLRAIFRLSSAADLREKRSWF